MEYKMKNDVIKFIEACDQTTSKETIFLYTKLIKEEYSEFVEAVLHNDEEEQLDACMDMIWVILGFCHMKGYNIQGAWDEVTKTNMAKVDPVTGKVRRREDGKILKPADWKEPDMSKFLKGY